jgi:hypothetical protein
MGTPDRVQDVSRTRLACGDIRRTSFRVLKRWTHVGSHDSDAVAINKAAGVPNRRVLLRKVATKFVTR